MYKIWIFLGLLIQPLVASDAEDFNPYDHIIQKPKPEITTNDDLEENKINNLENNPNTNNAYHADKRCICTCPAFDIPNVAKSDRLVYIGHAENAQGCSCSSIVLPMIKPKLSPNNIQLVQQDVCPTCRCDYQRRNVTMIFIVVTILCTIILLLVMYLFIWKICWPRFIRPMTYKEHTDEMIMEAMAGADPETESSAEQENLAPESSRSNNDGTKKSRFPVLDFLTKSKSKWQSDLQHQQSQTPSVN